MDSSKNFSHVPKIILRVKNHVRLYVWNKLIKNEKIQKKKKINGVVARPQRHQCGLHKKCCLEKVGDLGKKKGYFKK